MVVGLYTSLPIVPIVISPVNLAIVWGWLIGIPHSKNVIFPQYIG